MLKVRDRIFLILIFLLCMILSVTSISFAQPSDTKGHWAEKQINDWLSKGLARGYQDGTFKPDNSITRAEFMTLVNRSFGFTIITQINFSDVSSTDWFAGEVAKAKAAGYISGYQDGTVRPNNQISRQEVAGVLARILKLDTSANMSVLSKCKDAGDIPQWSKGSIGAVLAKGLMNGYPDQTYLPTKPITRAEAIATLDRAIKSFAQSPTYDKAGAYGPTSGTETIDGDVTINVAGVTLQNTKITGNLVLAEGIGDGDVTLKNVTVQGNTIIKGGGSHSIHLENCTLPSITVSKEGVRVVAVGNTSVDTVRLETGASLVEENTTGPGFAAVTLAESIPADANVSLTGDFAEVNIAAAKVKVAVVGGTVEKLYVAEKAAGATIDLASEAKVSTLTLDAAVSVTGKGKIETAKINVSGSTFEQKPTNVEQASDVSSTIGTGGGTGGGNGDAPLNLVGAYLETGESIEGSNSVPISPTIQLSFDRGVVRDYWEDNQSCISLQSSSGSDIAIDVFKKSGDAEKRNIYITPLIELTPGETYRIIIDANLRANNGNTLGSSREIYFTVTSPSGGGDGSGDNTPAAPNFVSSEVTNQGDVCITFDKEMVDPSGKHAQFTVKVDGADDIVTGATLTSDPKKIKLTLTTKVTSGQVVTVAYTKDNDETKQVKSVDGGVLQSFEAREVTNNLSGATPIVSPVLVSAEVTSQGDVSLTFNKEIAVPDSSSFMMAQICAQFTVKVGDNVDNVTEIQSTNTTGKIKLVLTTKVTSGQVVTVAYTKANDEAIQLKSTDGGIIESFEAITLPYQRQ